MPASPASPNPRRNLPPANSGRAREQTHPDAHRTPNLNAHARENVRSIRSVPRSPDPPRRTPRPAPSRAHRLGVERPTMARRNSSRTSPTARWPTRNFDVTTVARTDARLVRGCRATSRWGTRPSSASSPRTQRDHRILVTLRSGKRPRAPCPRILLAHLLGLPWCPSLEVPAHLTTAARRSLRCRPPD